MTIYMFHNNLRDMESVDSEDISLDRMGIAVNLIKDFQNIIRVIIYSGHQMLVTCICYNDR